MVLRDDVRLCVYRYSLIGLCAVSMYSLIESWTAHYCLSGVTCQNVRGDWERCVPRFCGTMGLE